jgi:hypothetical protein
MFTALFYTCSTIHAPASRRAGGTTPLNLPHWLKTSGASRFSLRPPRHFPPPRHGRQTSASMRGSSCRTRADERPRLEGKRLSFARRRAQGSALLAAAPAVPRLLRKRTAPRGGSACASAPSTSEPPCAQRLPPPRFSGPKGIRFARRSALCARARAGSGCPTALRNASGSHTRAAPALLAFPTPVIPESPCAPWLRHRAPSPTRAPCFARRRAQWGRGPPAGSGCPTADRPAPAPRAGSATAPDRMPPELPHARTALRA